MSEMVESVGIAIARNLDRAAIKELMERGAISPDTAWRIARAAIEAMRDAPITPEMVDAFWSKSGVWIEEGRGYRITELYRAMIDAALK